MPTFEPRPYDPVDLAEPVDAAGSVSTGAPDGVDLADHQAQVDRVAELLAPGAAVVLSGAGLSTESGIPGYRGADGQRVVHPMTADELLADVEARRRYWARSFVGWPRFAAARPNAGHLAVTRLQRAGLVNEVITQNVDGLHQQAGTKRVIDLHGSLAQVVCMNCSTRFPRAQMDAWMVAANPDFDRAAEGQVRPDGDVAIDEALVQEFRLVHCPVCTSDRLKPDVVMFGESVPKPTVARAYAALEDANCLLVLGSSLMVMSGFRFVRFAHRERIPVVALTIGRTRANGELTLQVQMPLGQVLTELADRLAP
ncbi:NAD-dependent protein deacetylase [Dermacoccaceae bacterium W4C1]